MKCLVIDYIDEDIYREFQKYMEVDLMMLPTKQTLIKIIEPYEVLIMRVDPEIDEEVLDAAKNLRFIGVCSTGLNHIDRAAAEKRGIIIRNAPGMNANGVAELTICKMLELARSTIQSNYEVQDRRQWNKYKYLGVELAGKTVGIIGFGSIGQRVGELCRVFGMQVLAYNPHGRPGEYFTARGAEAADLDTILRRSDFITIHAPLTDETRGMIGAQEIVKMKFGAFVINMSRGGIVVEQDMYAALISGQLGGYAADVMEEEFAGRRTSMSSPLIGYDRFIVSPHSGGQTKDSVYRISRCIFDACSEALHFTDSGK